MDQPLGSRYVLHELLGRGAMGQVYRASVRESGAAVAVKVLKPELVSDPEVVARFFQERSILTSIAHPHVVRVTDLVVEGETLGIVMELVQGTDLRRFLRERGTLPPGQAVGLVCQLLDGLAAVHAAGIVHRDVKPENVLVDLAGGQPAVRLTDFGVARLSYGGSLTKLSSLIGTPEYMAPEVAEHDTATPAVDLYSTGVVLYELLCGRTPFAGGHPLAVLRRHVEQPPPPVPGVPGPLWAQVAALLAKDPAARPPSAAQAAMTLSSLAGSLQGLPALPAMAEPGPGRWSQPGATPSSVVAPSAGATADNTPRDGTVLRRRDRGAGTGPTASTAPAGHPEKPRRRGRPVIIALPAALVVLAAAIGVLALRPGQQPSARAVTAAYAFAPQRLSNGVLVARRWALTGKNGSVLTETVALSSLNGKQMQAVFEEALPTVAALSGVAFTPKPLKIIQAGPAVEWDVLLPAGRSVAVGYRARVPAAGASRARLLRWAQTLQAAQSSLSPGSATVQLASLAITPRVLHMAPAATGQLKLAGMLANDKPAPAAVLAGAAWTSADNAVAIVDPAGQVTAIGPGNTYVTAQVGARQATVAVFVTGNQPGLAAGGSKTAGVVQPSSGSGTGGAGGGTGSVPSPHVTTPAQQPPPTTPAPPPPPPPPSTHAETVGGVTHTWTNYTNAGGTQGPSIQSYTTVQITCKITGFKVADGNTWWYRIASSPWSNAYYASADAFYNNGATSGSLVGTPWVDNSVPNC